MEPLIGTSSTKMSTRFEVARCRLAGRAPKRLDDDLPVGADEFDRAWGRLGAKLGVKYIV